MPPALIAVEALDKAGHTAALACFVRRVRGSLYSTVKNELKESVELHVLKPYRGASSNDDARRKFHDLQDGGTPLAELPREKHSHFCSKVVAELHQDLGSKWPWPGASWTGRDGWRAGLERYQGEAADMCRRYYTVWVPANMLVFTVVPVPLRIGFIATTSFGWLTAASFFTHQH